MDLQVKGLWGLWGSSLSALEFCPQGPVTPPQSTGPSLGWAATSLPHLSHSLSLLASQRILCTECTHSFIHSKIFIKHLIRGWDSKVSLMGHPSLEGLTVEWRTQITNIANMFRRHIVLFK